MKKTTLFILLSLAFPALAFSAERPCFTYGKLQTIGTYPLIGAGLRMRKEHHGVDFSIAVLPLPWTPVLFHAKSLYFFYPALNKGLYGGVGLGLLTALNTIRDVIGSFEASLGYEWRLARKVRMFVEVNGILPFEKSNGDAQVWPGISIGIGY